MADLKTDLITLSRYAYRRLRARLDGPTAAAGDDEYRAVISEPLSDEEYLWEPAPDCWTIHPGPDGAMRADHGLLFDEPAPLTTLAWRMAHLIECLSAERCSTWLGLDPKPPVCPDGPPRSAADAVDALERAADRWHECIDALSDDDLRTPLGPIAGQYADGDRAGFVLHIIDELVHHAAEIALLRDLYRAIREQRDPFVAACLRGDREAVERMRASDDGLLDRTRQSEPDLVVKAAQLGRWPAIGLLADLGFPVDGTTGRTALHHAAAQADPEVVSDLIRRGADLTARDPVFNETPLGWARFFRRREAAEILLAAEGDTRS